MADKNRKFIGIFVNEMYAILIGIGLGNVIFGQKIDLTNVFEVVMALFITSVVLMYWWDWVEFVSENVVTNKREFIIDFIGLITLEFLFGYYKDPVSLAKIFIALGIIDLTWVINFLYQNRHKRSIKGKQWIFRKIFSILIYSTSYIVIVFLSAKYPEWCQGLVLITAYIMVRRFCFTHVKKIGPFKFRTAHPDDSNEIAEINNCYFNKFKNKNGFLITKLNKNNLKKNITKDKDRFFVACDNRNMIVGFLEVISSSDQDILNNLTWIDPHLKKVFYDSNEKLYIEKVAVQKKYLKHNIARFMYKSLFEEFPETLFYCFIVLKPYENTSSLKFHKKCGFLKAATYRNSELFGLKNYESVLLVRLPEKNI